MLAILKLLLLKSGDLGCFDERNLIAAYDWMVSLVAIPLLVSHHVDAIDDHLEVQVVAPIFVYLYLGESERQLILVADDSLGEIGARDSKVTALPIGLIEDKADTGIEASAVMHHEY